MERCKIYWLISRLNTSMFITEILDDEYVGYKYFSNSLDIELYNKNKRV